MESKARAGSSTFTASRSTSRWPSSAAHRCGRSHPANRSTRKFVISTFMKTTITTKLSWRTGSNKPVACREKKCDCEEESQKEGEQQLEETRGRCVRFPKDRRPDQGARRLARRDARSHPRPDPGSRSGRGRVVEVGHSGVGARWHPLHRRDLQERGEDYL